MRVLLIDQEAMGLDFVLRCVHAGHDVKWYRYSTKPLRDGEGFVGFSVVEDWRPHMRWARDGIVITTGNWRFLSEIDRYREFGYENIFSPTRASALLEIDRGKGMQAMQAAGIELPPYQTFASLREAADFCLKSDTTHVFKPMGDEGDKSLTYVSKDPEDLYGWLHRQIKAGKKLKGKCMLQEKIEMLCEVGVSGWFGPEGFLEDKWQMCVEHKNLMNGEVGPATGEMGTVTQYSPDDTLALTMLKPLEPALRVLGHRGDFAIGCGIDTKGRAWPFEFTARLGWPAFFIQCASHKGDPVQWMKDLLVGKDTLRVSYDTAVGVVCAQPNFPYNNAPAEKVEGNPITGLETLGSNVHLVSVMLGKGMKVQKGTVTDILLPQTTGEYVLVCTGLGKGIERARDKVYSTVKKVHFPNMMYRTDIGEKVQEVLPEVHKFGFLMGMES